MTTPAALRELADRFKDAIDTNMMDGTARRTLHKLVDELRTAASEGMAKPFAHLVMTEWNSIAWWTTESAERAQQEADELMRYDSMRKLTVVTVYTHPPEVARDAGQVNVADVAMSWGNFGQADGSTLIGWRVSAETVAAMGMASMVMPKEIGEDLERLRAIATWWETGSTERREKLQAALVYHLPDDRDTRVRLWDAILPLVDAITAPPQTATSDAALRARAVGDA